MLQRFTFENRYLFGLLLSYFFIEIIIVILPIIKKGTISVRLMKKCVLKNRPEILRDIINEIQYIDRYVTGGRLKMCVYSLDLADAESALSNL